MHARQRQMQGQIYPRAIDRDTRRNSETRSPPTFKIINGYSQNCNTSYPESEF